MRGQGRKNVFCTMQANESPSKTAGGNQVDFTANTENAKSGDCVLKVTARVIGNVRADERRKNGDDRISVFDIELPDQTDGHVRVNMTGPDLIWPLPFNKTSAAAIHRWLSFNVPADVYQSLRTLLRDEADPK
jgi:hypothetical protein